MCCGSGTIGLSVFKETKLKTLTLSDIDPSISKSINSSFKLNNFTSTKVKLIISDGFKNFKNKIKYDLISLNPPFFNFKRTKNNHLNGHDYKFKFNKNFFRLAGDFLKPKGQILFIKPIDGSVKGVLLDSEIQKFISNSKLEFKKKLNIKGTHYCIFFLGLKNE
jgi:tRNA1(Val) A37 N6-methylase TrmN6